MCKPLFRPLEEIQRLIDDGFNRLFRFHQRFLNRIHTPFSDQIAESEVGSIFFIGIYFNMSKVYYVDHKTHDTSHMFDLVDYTKGQATEYLLIFNENLVEEGYTVIGADPERIEDLPWEESIIAVYHKTNPSTIRLEFQEGTTMPEITAEKLQKFDSIRKLIAGVNKYDHDYNMPSDTDFDSTIEVEIGYTKFETDYDGSRVLGTTMIDNADDADNVSVYLRVHHKTCNLARWIHDFPLNDGDEPADDAAMAFANSIAEILNVKVWDRRQPAEQTTEKAIDVTMFGSANALLKRHGKVTIGVFIRAEHEDVSDKIPEHGINIVMFETTAARAQNVINDIIVQLQKSLPNCRVSCTGLDTISPDKDVNIVVLTKEDVPNG